MKKKPKLLDWVLFLGESFLLTWKYWRKIREMWVKPGLCKINPFYFLRAPRMPDICLAFKTLNVQQTDFLKGWQEIADIQKNKFNRWLDYQFIVLGRIVS